MARRGLGNFVTDLHLINSLAPNLEVDQGFSASDMANLILEFHNVTPNSVPQYTLPVVQDSQSYFYRGGGYGDVVFPVQPEDAQVVAQFLGTTRDEGSSGQTLPSTKSFTVAVENGGGQYGMGEKTATALEALGYNVGTVTNAEVGASTTETTVLYSDPSKLGDALKVQSDVSGLAIVGYDPGLFGAVTTGSGTLTSAGAGPASHGTDVGSPLPVSTVADVVVVTGSNFAVNAPPGSGPTATLGSGCAVQYLQLAAGPERVIEYYQHGARPAVGQSRSRRSLELHCGPPAVGPAVVHGIGRGGTLKLGTLLIPPRSGRVCLFSVNVLRTILLVRSTSDRGTLSEERGATWG